MQHKTKNSMLNATVAIEQKALEQLLNEQLKGPLFEQGEGNDLQIKATKSGEIKIDIFGQKLKLLVPLKIEISKDLLLTSAKADGIVQLTFESDLSFSNAWQLETNTNVTDFKWLDKPELEVGFLSVPVETLVFKTFEKRKDELCNVIDQQIAKQLDLTPYADQLSTLLKKPVQLNPNYPFWMKMVPVATAITPFKIEKGILSTIVRLVAKMDFSLEKEPSPNEDFNLPAPRFLEVSNPKSNLVLPLKISYNDLAKLVAREVKSKDFTYDDYTIQIVDVDIKKANELLKIKAVVEGSFKGEAIIYGLPVYNELEEAIYIENFDLELSTKNLLHKGLIFLLKNKMEEKIKEQLVFPIKNLLTENVLDSIQEFEVMKGVKHFANIDSLSLNNLMVEDQSLSFEVISDLESTFKIDVQDIVIAS